MRLLAPTLLAALLTACTGASPEGDVLIRVENVSAFDYAALVVGEHTIGDLASGESTEPLLFEGAYHYNYVSLEIDGEALVLQPIDYVGETPLEPGSWVYEIDVEDPASGNIRITTVADGG